jgi:hypothetical protein
MDSWAYLQAGFKVVAVEADPSLVTAATQNANFIPSLQNAQLTLLNFAIAPAQQTVPAWLPFYMNKCTKEWNSFFSNVGCRSCAAPHGEDPTACIPQNVLATPCASVLQQHGIPKYFKLDIEGAEDGCYHALGQLPEASRPLYLSGEVTNDKLIDTYAQLGYKSFKIMRQEGGHSGAWGDGVMDCRTGKLWRSVDGARQELQQIHQKAANPADPCPGFATGNVWYDVHASRSPHQTW